MSCSFGEKFRVTVFGQSHSDSIGVVIDGIPAGIKLDMNRIERFMSRRAPGKNAYSTKRKEADKPEIISGVVDNITCGAPLCAVIKNSDQHSNDYSKLKDNPRPSHSDFAAYMKHNGFNDIRGGGNFSGRMTAPMCFAGAVALQILSSKGITIGAHISKIGHVSDDAFSPTQITAEQLNNISLFEFPVINPTKGNEMKQEIEDARMSLDSVGGIIECATVGVKAGIGEPMFDGLENKISQAVFAVPAVKGIEFGNGFGCAELLGSENNDEFIVSGSDVITKTNNHGGILGGISSGMPIIFRVAIKPTPSIGKEQSTVNLSDMTNTKLTIEGRHDPCIVPRAVPCIEAAAAIAIINLM